MPILIQPTPASQRRRPWLWALLGVPGVVGLLLTGLVMWSWDHPVKGTFGRTKISFGRAAMSQSVITTPTWDFGATGGFVVAPVPGDSNRSINPYVVDWSF
jgi:hypothetical protein